MCTLKAVRCLWSCGEKTPLARQEQEQPGIGRLWHQLKKLFSWTKLQLNNLPGWWESDKHQERQESDRKTFFWFDNGRLSGENIAIWKDKYDPSACSDQRDNLFVSGKTGEQTGSRGGRSGGGGEGGNWHQSHLREIFTNLNLILILAIMILLLSGVAETGKRNANASFPIHINWGAFDLTICYISMCVHIKWHINWVNCSYFKMWSYQQIVSYNFANLKYIFSKGRRCGDGSKFRTSVFCSFCRHHGSDWNCCLAFSSSPAPSSPSTPPLCWLLKIRKLGDGHLHQLDKSGPSSSSEAWSGEALIIINVSRCASY